MERRHTYTPREAAHAIAIDWLRATYEERTNDLEQITHGEIAPESYKRRIKRQIAKLHNRLLEDSGMDGLPLDAELAP